MSKVVTPEEHKHSLKNLSTDELKQKLGGLLKITADTLKEASFVWAELELRGEDLSALKQGLLAFLPDIADGYLDPNVLIQCAGNKTLIKELRQLSLDEQKKLLTNGITVVEINHLNKTIKKNISLSELKIHEFRLAYKGRERRSVSEQVKVLNYSPNKTIKRVDQLGVSMDSDLVKKVKEQAAQNGISISEYVKRAIMEFMNQ